MKRPLIMGNWKLHKEVNEAVSLVKKLKTLVKGIVGIDIVVCPTFTALHAVSKVKGNIQLGAQNCYFEKQGAFTGEVSPKMLKDVGCKYVILGHSERRKIFNETNEFINKKVKAALKDKLTVVLCVGETLSQRRRGLTKKIIREELNKCLKGVSIKNVVIAYEPIWAIGTGKTATPKQAQEVHAFIKSVLKRKYGSTADHVRIIYGGSVNSKNIKSLMAEKDITGALVGGASLKAKEFSKIVKF